MRWGLGVAWLAGAAAALTAVATVAHALVSPAPEAGVAEAVMLGAPVLASAVAGLVIATRAPGNRVGGLLLVSACALALFAAALHVGGQGLVTAPDAPATSWAALWVHSGWPTFYAGLIGLAFVFPDGRLASPRWRPVAWAVALAFGGFLVLALFDPRPFYPPFDAVPKPLPVADVATVLTVGEFVLLAPLLVAIAAVVARYRRSSGLARAQLRWFAFAAILVPATFVTCMVEYLSTGAVGGATYLATSVTQVAVVAAVTVAVLRYRLFEIDTLISRTAGYAVLTGLLAAVYVAIALVGGVAVGTGSRWTTAAATLAVAFAFRPLRARVQRSSTAGSTATASKACAGQSASSPRCARDGRSPRTSAGCSPRPWVTITSSCTSGSRTAPCSPTRVASSTGSCPRTAGNARPSAAVRSSWVSCCTHRRTGPRCFVRCWRRSGWPSRSLGCGSKSACSSRKFRPRVRASSKRATKNAGASSATCTTAPSSASSRSVCRSDDSS